MKENKSTVLWTFLPLAIIVVFKSILMFAFPYRDFSTEQGYIFYGIAEFIIRISYFVGISVFSGISFIKVYNNNDAYQNKLLRIAIIIMAVIAILLAIITSLVPLELWVNLGTYCVIAYIRRKERKQDSAKDE